MRCVLVGDRDLESWKSTAAVAVRGPRFLTHSSMPTLQLWGGKLGTMDKAVFVYRMVLRFNLFHVMRGREALSRGELPDGIMRTLAQRARTNAPDSSTALVRLRPLQSHRGGASPGAARCAAPAPQRARAPRSARSTPKRTLIATRAARGG